MWSLRRLRMPCPDKTPNDKNILFANEDNKYQIISTGLLNLPNSRIFTASMRLCKDALELFQRYKHPGLEILY